MPRGKRREVVPSLHTGAQTARKRKPGARVTSKYAFAGEGTTLASSSDKGTGFGKQASRYDFQVNLRFGLFTNV